MSDRIDPLFESSEEVISKIERPMEPKKITWVIEGMDNPYNWPIIKDGGRLQVEVGEGNKSSVIEFRFREHTVTSQTRPIFCDYLSLFATLVSNKNTPNRTFEIEVHYAGSKFDEPTVILPKCVVHFDQWVVGVKSNFLHTQSYNCLYNVSTGEHREDAIHTCYPEKIYLAFTINPVHLTAQLLPSPGSANITNFEASEKQQSISSDVSKYYTDMEDNYSDLKLESRDGIVLKAHRFILGARNKSFHNLLEKHCKSNNFDGTIKLEDVDAKPLTVILHWIYTGTLKNDTENFLEDLVIAAVKYELKELLKLLDGQLIKICNPNNMLQLFQLAKQNGMAASSKHIADFIKKNID